jgi:hypothetical protein
VLFQAPLGSIESITDGNVDISVGSILSTIPIDDQGAARDADSDMDSIQITLPMVTMRRFHCHSTTHDSVVEARELRRSLANTLFNEPGGLQAVEVDL